jgi:drug/metabolite transporter (DMT)-like permease
MSQAENEQPGNRDRSRRLLVGLCVGIGVGLALGVALDSIPAGFVLGVGLGVSLGLAFSGQRREPSKPLTIAGILLLAVGIVLLAVIMSLVRPQWWCDYPILNLVPGC